ncbi:taste receptor type 1 member 1 [Callorhinchus milii]|uniref:taste receptor type 1 member 1 n=1 Tax=Callorhinchus milii TaxID=7868 RepID=UPI001C3F8D55|nr:taste receptor type 1 member 1 [Callorhinchus milii]
MWLLLAVVLCLVAQAANTSNIAAAFSLPGDYVIGGLFPIHYAQPNGVNQSEPITPDCQRFPFYMNMYVNSQAMRFAVEEINSDRRLLPGVRLGYNIADTCFQSVDVQTTLHFLSARHLPSPGIPTPATNTDYQPGVPISSNYTSYQPNVIAIIGPASTTITVTIARFLGYFLVPLISYAASGEVLGNRIRFPSFFRTIPNDIKQAEAMALLIQEFGWNWIAAVGSDNEYGRQGINKVVELVTGAGTCVAYQAIIPSSRPELVHMLNEISASVNVTVLFSSRLATERLFRVLTELNVTGKVWIISETVALSEDIARIPGVAAVGTVLGIAIKEGHMEGFREFLAKGAASEPRGSCDQECRRLLAPAGRSAESPEYHVDTRVSYNVYVAVYAMAHALHQLLQCEQDRCYHPRAVYPWQLLSSLKKVRFLLSNETFYFDETGDGPSGFDIVTWQSQGHGIHFQTIGSYLPLTHQLDIDRSLIHWPHNSTYVPVSHCSESCGPGQRRIPRGFHSCCFDCEDCPAGTFRNQSDPYECAACPWWQWSPAQSERCLDRAVQYLSWQNPLTVLLLLAANSGLALTVTISVVFAWQLDSPVVKSAGGRMCFAMLASMLCGFSCVYLFIGKPSTTLCRVQHPIFAISFSLCLSCILVRSFQIVSIFKMASSLPRAYKFWLRYSGPGLFVVLSTALQLTMCVAWLVAEPPSPRTLLTGSIIALDCSTGNVAGLALSFLYIVLLTGACFLLAYIGRDLPENYNEAKFIAFSMTLCFVYYILYMASLVTPTQQVYTSSIRTFLTINSAASVALGYFLPKCYIILFQPQLNTAAHFQSCLQDYTKKQSEGQ